MMMYLPYCKHILVLSLAAISPCITSTASGAILQTETTAQISPYDLNQVESAKPNWKIKPGNHPVQYRQTYYREREKFTYNPRYMPEAFSFDAYNRPYVISTVYQTPSGTNPTKTSIFGHAKNSTDSLNDIYIQTLNQSDNQWIIYSVNDIVKSQFKNAELYGGTKNRPKIYFDQNNHAHVIVRGTNDTSYYLYSNDQDLSTASGINPVTWQVGRMNVEDVTSVERHFSPGQDRDTPIVSVRTKSAPDSLQYFKAEISNQGLVTNSNGYLTLSNLKTAIDPSGQNASSFPVAPKLPAGHSGAGNITATHNGHTVISFMSNHTGFTDSTGTTHNAGSPQFAASYDWNTDSASSPQFLEVTYSNKRDYYDNVPDQHNSPISLIDSDGYAHVITGAHNDQIGHFRTSDAVDNSNWDGTYNSLGDIGPANLGYEGGDRGGGFTYLSGVMDSDDTIHLVVRDSEKPLDGSTRGFALSYLRGKKNAEGQWEWETDERELVNPERGGYNIYYQQLTIDNNDNLYLTYSYKAGSTWDAISQEELAEYKALWPDDPENLAHDPVTWASYDGGNTWLQVTTDRLATQISDTPWPQIPEPTSLSLLILGSLITLSRKQRL
ncbi:BNR-4 repeat-containing protein [Planctomycetota bacterium]|nr:BNR-4 repeat-containing protein [Planctomycetota bacterium]